jgi:hypothetical protein
LIVKVPVLPAPIRKLTRGRVGCAQDLPLPDQGRLAEDRRGQNQPEFDRLRHIVKPTRARGEKVRRLYVALDQARGVRRAQRPATLPCMSIHALSIHARRYVVSNSGTKMSSHVRRRVEKVSADHRF